MTEALTGFQKILERQHNRLLRLSFPNEDGPAVQLLVNKLDAYEALSRPFEYKVELLSDDPNVALKNLQGKMMCVQLVRQDGTMRYFTGRVFSFRLRTVDGGISYYEARLGPWYSYLSLRKDNYLFHYNTLYQQCASIFGDYGSLADWDWRVQGATEVMTDACQFDESDRNYLERRWAAAGIFYWFEHTAKGHMLILSDDSTAVPAVDGDPEIPYQSHGGSAEEDGINAWSPARKIVNSDIALSAFDFKAPHPVQTELPTVNQQGDVPRIESYEYVGAHGFLASDGRALAQLRMEEVEADGKQFEGGGNNRFVMPGRWFRLTGHFDGEGSDDDQAREFLIKEVRHSASNNYHIKDSAESKYSNELTCVRKIIPYRVGRGHNCIDTKIHGIQTATVVGPAGEEIHTDEYGRVRVQFHWDRVGTNDEKSSAWLRVATPWAGSNFGITSIPRIGTEVLVQFLDGNPDRPIITGMVPNASTMPPWPLPGNKTQSGMLSRSTPGGSYDNANALRFEDKKGQEQLWLHAEKDQLTEVENDESKWVGNDRTKTIDRDETSHIKRDRTETVNRNETITIHKDRTERVGHNETISIGDNRNEDVGKNETVTIGGNRVKSVVKNERDDIGKSWAIHVGKFKTETIGMAYMQNVGLGRMENVGMAYNINVGLGYNLNVGMGMLTIVGMSQTTKVGKKISITAGQELSIRVGKSSLVMKADGTVTINGSKFKFEASGPVKISGKDVDVN